jgi:DNA-binding CsgD family transcriptional regulator
MTRSDDSSIVAAIYEAATGGLSWIELGERLRNHVNAGSVALRIDEEGENALMPFDATWKIYHEHFYAIDPLRIRCHTAFSNALVKESMAFEEQSLIPRDALVRTEYYNDYARHNGQHYSFGGVLAVDEGAPIAFYRDLHAGAFDTESREQITRLLRHLERGLRVYRDLKIKTSTADSGLAALAALPLFVAIVDADLRVKFINTAGVRLMKAPNAGLFFALSGMPESRESRLRAFRREDDEALKKLVYSAVRGGPGGTMLVRAHGVRSLENDMSMALVVSPIPARVGVEDNARGGLASGTAMVLARPLTASVVPRGDMLCDFFGLTFAEAAVAVALLGGATAEDVARSRGVSLGTIRTQIRVVLNKMNARNLRHVEQIVAGLSVLFPASLGHAEFSEGLNY